MIDYEYFDLFNSDSTDKQFYIGYAGGTLTNDDLFSERIEIIENLCSENTLRFGSCESCYAKFKTGSLYILDKNSEISVSMSLSEDKSDPFIENPRTSDRFVIGKYHVKSNTLTADKEWREVTAYDAMYDIINADMTKWYNSVLPNKDSKMYLWQFRESFVRYFGLTEVVPTGGLVNDNIIVERTIDPEQISGKDIITAICEINGCFGHIGRDGKFHYIYLPQAIEGLYPANDLYPDHAPEYMAQAKTGHLYPQDPKGITVGKNKNYIECTYEDFVTAGITHVQIRGSENDAGYTYPSDPVTEKDNLYIIEDNFLAYGKSDAELMQIEINLLSKISNITYRPYNLKVRANPCIEVGDAIKTSTDRQLIESYVLQRTMTGTQAFTDNLSATGTEKFEQNVNSVQKSIIQLKGKTNTLTRTQEETRSELKDLEAGTESKFVQTSAEIQAEVTRAQGAEGQLSSRINLTAEEISAEVTRAKGAESSLSSSISQTATQIRTEVANADAALSSSITQNANQIALKVSKGDVSSQISLESGQVTISGNRLVVDSSNFKLDAYGNAKFYGEVQSDDITAVGKYWICETFNGTKTECLILAAGRLFVGWGSLINSIRLQKDTTIAGDLTVTGNISGTVSYAESTSEAGYAESAGYADYAGGLSGAPSIRVSNIYLDSWSSGSSLLPIGMNASTGHFGHLTGSSKRFKNTVTDIVNDDLDPKRLYNIPVRQFKYNTDYLMDKNDCRYDTFVPGFIAEEIEKEYRTAVDYSDSGEVMDWNYKYIIPPMLALIQEQHREIEFLKMSLSTMQQEFAILKKEMEELKNA